MRYFKAPHRPASVVYTKGFHCRKHRLLDVQFYEQQPSAKPDPARARKYITTAAGPPPPGATQGGRKATSAKARQWARQVRFEQRHGGGVSGSEDDEDAAQALLEQVTCGAALVPDHMLDLGVRTITSSRCADQADIFE